MHKYTKFSVNRSINEAKEIYKQRIEDALSIYSKHQNNFTHRVCFLCGENDFVKIQNFHDSFEITKCNVCASESVNPVPSEDALIDYYNNGRCNILLDALSKSRYKKELDFIMDDRVKVVLDLIEKIDKTQVNLLEIGCSSGAFLSKLRYFIDERLPGKQVFLSGIDIDANAIQASVDPSLELYVANAELYVKKAKINYDIIVHFELIEHLPNPYSFMVSLHNLLNVDSFMYFTTPNADGLEILASSYNDYRPLAHSIFPPMHLNAFSFSNIKHFAIRSGFKVLDVNTPGKLDMDMLTLFEGELDEGLKKLLDLDEDSRGLIQHLVSYLNGSSHMGCIFKKK